jgi:ribonuclease P protein component
MPYKGKSETDRLKKRSDFLRLQHEGRKWISPNVIVQIAIATTDNTRAGFTATKKLGNAVMRNRIKRRMREAAKQVLKDAETPHDIVLIGRHDTATCPFPNLIKDLKWCLKRLEVTHDAIKPVHPAA